MDDARCFVDVDVPARPAVVPGGDAEFTIPEDISSFWSGLTPEGYFFDVDGEAPQEEDFGFLQDLYAGETILLDEPEALKGGVDDITDDLRLVLAIRITLLLQYQLVKVQPIPCENGPDLKRYAFVQLTDEAVERRSSIWNKVLTRARSQVSKGKRKRRQEQEEEDEVEVEDEDEVEDEAEEEDEGEAEEKVEVEAEAEGASRPWWNWSSGEVGEGAVLKDNVVWSSTEAGFPLCTFRSFGTDSRSDGTITMNLTSSAKDEARVFQSSADLKAWLLATLDAYAAAIVRTKASIIEGGMHPSAAFTLSSAPEATVAVVVGTQEAQSSPISTPSAVADPPKKNKVAHEVGTAQCRRRRLDTSEAAISPRRRSQRNASMNEQQARVLEVALLAQGATDALVQDKLSNLFSGSGVSATVFN
jgi:hypothetical protein